MRDDVRRRARSSRTPTATTAPRSSPARLAGEGGQVVLGWMPEHREWLAGPIRGWALMGGYALGAPITEGRLRYLPTRLSAVPHVLAALRPEIVVIPAVRRGAELVYGRSVGWAPAAAAVAARGRGRGRRGGRRHRRAADHVRDHAHRHRAPTDDGTRADRGRTGRSRHRRARGVPTAPRGDAAVRTRRHCRCRRAGDRHPGTACGQGC